MTDERAACADRLDRLAADPRFDSRADDLRSLAAAVRDQGDGTWTGMDLIGAFPPEASINVGKQHWLERVLGILAGAFVFAPVAWTWWSIGEASRAYRDLMATGDETGRTFLGMWTSGFDGRLDGLHAFVPMAMISFGLVALAVLFVVLNRVVSDYYIQHEESSGGAARRDLVGALGRAQRFLNERRTDDPRFLEAALKRSVGQLNKAHAATLEGVEALQTATISAVSQLESVSAKVIGELGPLLITAQEASRSLATSAESASGLQEKVLASTQEFDATLRGALKEFTDTVRSSSVTLTQGSGEAATTMTEGVNRAVEGLTEGVKKMQSSHLESTKLVSNGVEAQAMSAAATKQATDRLSDLLEGHQAALQGQAGDLTRAADLAGQLLAELQRQGR